MVKRPLACPHIHRVGRALGSERRRGVKLRMRKCGPVLEDVVDPDVGDGKYVGP